MGKHGSVLQATAGLNADITDSLAPEIDFKWPAWSSFMGRALVAPMEKLGTSRFIRT